MSNFSIWIPNSFPFLDNNRNTLCIAIKKYIKYWKYLQCCQSNKTKKCALVRFKCKIHANSLIQTSEAAKWNELWICDDKWLYGNSCLNRILVKNVGKPYCQWKYLRESNEFLLLQTDNPLTVNNAAVKWSFVGFVESILILKCFLVFRKLVVIAAMPQRMLIAMQNWILLIMTGFGMCNLLISALFPLHLF